MLHFLGIAALVIVAIAVLGGSRGSGAAERLGDVLYWGASAVALIIALLITWSEIFHAPDQLGISLLGGFAVLLWLGGRACRYVLAGR